MAYTTVTLDRERYATAEGVEGCGGSNHVPLAWTLMQLDAPQPLREGVPHESPEEECESPPAPMPAAERPPHTAHTVR